MGHFNNLATVKTEYRFSPSFLYLKTTRLFLYKVVYKVVTRLLGCLQGCYKVVTTRLFTRLLQGCYKVVTRLLQGFTVSIAYLLPGCYNLVTRLLQPCVFSMGTQAKQKRETTPPNHH